MKQGYGQVVTGTEGKERKGKRGVEVYAVKLHEIEIG